MNTSMNIIESTSLSDAWCQALNLITKNPGRELVPLTVTLIGFEESENVRKILDDDLACRGEQSIQTVADTIFPNQLYELSEGNRNKLYEMYKLNLPRIKKIEPLKNGRGTYFERLIAYNGDINQLDIIIKSILDNRSSRRSKLQASIFDPKQDHRNSPYQGFPCLQHVSFYINENEGLVLNSFYPIQLLYRKAYGNWLGLINLGKFVAKEINMRFEKLICFVGVEQWEIQKGHADKLLRMIK